MKVLQTLNKRWKAESPKLFKWIYRVSGGISVVAITMQTALTTAGIEAPGWFSAILPNVICITAGAAAVAKLTIKDNSNDEETKSNY